MVKFVGAPLDIPTATASTHAVRKDYVDAADTALAGRVTTLESGSGGQSFAVRAVSTTTTANVGDFVLANAASAAFTVTLPSNPGVNKAVAVKKVDSSTNLVTVVGAGGSTIDGDSTLTLLQAQSGAVLVYDGTNWRVESTVIFDPGAKNFTYRGDWSGSVTYAINDVAYYQGNSYVAILGNTNVTPTTDASSATWGLIALHGATGSGGGGGGATVAVGTTTTGAPGSNASVTNSGTSTAAIFNFTIPAGATGATGPGFAYQGVWSSSTSYALRDVVTFNGSSYVALQAGTNQNPGTATAYWSVLASKGDQGTTGTAGTNGAAATVAVGTTTTGAAGSNASVTNSGSSSAAVFNFTIPTGATGAAGTNGTNGTNGTGFTYRGQWTSGTAYAVNDIVINNRSTFVVTQAHTASTVPDPYSVGAPPYDPWAVGFSFVGQWISGTTYYRNNVVVHNGTAYVLTGASTTSSTVAPGPNAQWSLYTLGMRYIGTYAAGTAYVPGNVVLFNNQSYVNLTASTGTAPTDGSTTATWGFLAAKGVDGAAATVAVGTTTTGAAGSSASVTNSGSSSAAVFNFTVPTGATGATGPGVATGGTTGQVLVKNTSTNYDTSWTKGVFPLQLNTVSTTFTAPLNSFIEGNAASAGFTITLQGSPAAADRIVIKKVDSSSNTITVVPSAGTIDGAANVLLSAAQSSVDLTYDGTAWKVTSSYLYGSGGASGSSGGGLTPSAVKTAAYTPAVGELVLANAAGGGFTVTLPSTTTAGTTVGVKKVDSSANAVTVVGSGGSTIDGDTTATLNAQNAAARFVNDGTNWQIQSTAVLSSAAASSTSNTDQLLPASYTVGNWYSRRNAVPATGNTGGTATPAVTTIYYVPMLLTKQVLIDQVALLQNTASTTGAICRVGAYYATAGGVPGNLISDFGTITLSTTAQAVCTTSTFSAALPKGTFYFALSFNATASGALFTTLPASNFTLAQGVANGTFTAANFITTAGTMGAALYTQTGTSTASALGASASGTAVYANLPGVFDVFFRVIG